MRFSGRAAAVGAMALAVALFADVLRVWMPSIMFVYGRAGTTSPIRMGAFALVPFVVAVGVGLLLRRVRPADVALVGAAALALTRIGLQATSGGNAQLWLATAGVIVALSLLVALAGILSAGVAIPGLVAGFALDAASHALLRSTGLAWRDGWLPWLVVAAVCLALVVCVLRLHTRHDVTGAGVRGWVVLGPALLLHLVLGSLVSRVLVLSGWTEPVAVGLVLAAHVAALGVLARAETSRRLGPAGGLLVVAAVAATLWLEQPALAAGAQLVLPAALALSVRGALADRVGASSGAHAAAPGGLLVFVVLAFGYYASYDMAIGVDNRLFLLVGALLLGAAALRAWTAASPALAWVPGSATMATLVVFVIVGTSAMVLAVEVPAPEEGDGFPVRVMTYNLQMGFDVRGTYSGPRLAAVVAGEAPDIVALNEVSRGWLINASADVYPDLVEGTALPGVFRPAADRVWGNALLARYPVRDARGIELPQAGADMARSMISAVVDLGRGDALGVVATHLHHRRDDREVRREQVVALVAEVRRLQDEGLPVVVLGDLNAEPGDPELAPLEELMRDATAGADTLATHPSWDPQRHIDHVYVTPDLQGHAVSVPPSDASDHLGVAVTLERVQ